MLKFARIVALGLLVGSTVFAAPLVVNFASVTGSSIQFSGSGTGATFTTPAVDEGAPNHLMASFVITTINGPWTSSSALNGLFGRIDGTFGYDTSGITTNVVGDESAPVTTVTGAGGGSGPARFSIYDGTGPSSSSNTFTADLTWESIKVSGTGGSLNSLAVVNLSNFSYGGSNADLLQLVTDNTRGIVTATFQFIPALDLYALAAAGASNTTSLSGTLVAVPEPKFILALVAGLLAVIVVHGRKSAAVKAL